MTEKRNYHTHTIYCDGVNSPEEIVNEALAEGFSAIGFSGHTHMSFDESYAMSREKTKLYKKDIAALKEKYRGRIEIYCGIEQDYYSDEDTKGWDYVIGSVHYVYKNGKYIPVDETADMLLSDVSKQYGGDMYSLIEDYYKTVSDVVNKTNADIIGHFDLITKFNEGEKLFSESDPRYIKAYRASLLALVKTEKPFEINTGAMSRGYRSNPYPSKAILKDIFNMGGGIIFSSDSHEKSTLCYAFDKAYDLAKECGFRKALILTEKGFEEVNI